MKKLLLLQITILLIVSCQKVLEIPMPEFQSKAVVNCFFAADTNIILKLSQTSNINDSLETLVYDAKVLLKQNNIVIDTLNYTENGFYISKVFPQIGNNYSIEVQTVGLGTYTASSYIPNSLTINSVSQQDFAVPLNDNQFDGDVRLPASRFSFTITDPINEKNYYEVTLGKKEDWNDSGYHYFSILNPISYDNVIVNEDILDYKPTTIVFSDSLFNGQTKTFEILYKIAGYSMAIGNDGTVYYYNPYRLMYSIRSISKEMYLYRKALIRHLYNQQTDNILTFGDPVQMWSNISDGYGVFAGYTGITDSIFVTSTEFQF